MEKKIEALKAAYQTKDEAKLRKAAAALVAYDRKHPFAALVAPLGDGDDTGTAGRIVALATRIAEAPGTFF